jgi:hypothetical protein
VSEPPGEIRYFFIRRPVLAAVISIVITLLGRIRADPVADQPVSPDHAASGPGHRRLSGRQRRRRGPGSGRADRAAALRAGWTALLPVGQLEHRSDVAVGVLRYLRDQDLAAVEVQNAVKLAEPQLPEEVRRNGIVVQKTNTNILLVAALVSDDPGTTRCT